MAKDPRASLASVLGVGVVLCFALALSRMDGLRAVAQITNESPPPGYPPSGCDYDQRGNYYCWGGGGGTKTAKPTPTPPPVFYGCYHWFNGGQVQIRANHTVVAGPFSGTWQVVDAAKRMYAITWQQPGVSTVTVSADQKSLSGGNQYGGKDSATRVAGGNGLVGTWSWMDIVSSKVTVKADGTFSAASSTAHWSGTWKPVAGSARTYTLHRPICRRTA